jgi:hypothetical protein
LQEHKLVPVGLADRAFAQRNSVARGQQNIDQGNLE